MLYGMGRIEWAMWANEQAVMSCCVLAFGSLIGVSSLLLEKPHVRWHLSVYSLILSLLIFILEYPRGKRAKGHTRKRSYQEYATKIVSKLGVFGKNYFLRFFMYTLFSIPTLFNLASCTGGLCLIMTAFIYIKAALEDEHWFPCGPEIVKRRSLSLPRPPSIAPPRLPNFTNKDALDCVVYSAVAFDDCMENT